MRFRYAVEVEVERTSGKFASRDVISEQLVEALETADPSMVEGDDEGGQYEIVQWDVSEEEARR